MPTGTNNGPAVSFLEGTRVTQVNYVENGKSDIVNDCWLNPQDRNRCLETKWTGCSVFVLAGNRPCPQVSPMPHTGVSEATPDEEDEDDPVNKLLELRVKMALQPELSEILMCEAAVLAQEHSN